MCVNRLDVDFKNLKREELSISFPESRHEQYRLVIENRDSPPLNVEGIEAEGDVYEAVYLGAPNKHYQLVYGAPDAERPAYDTAAIQELLGKAFQPSPAELGAERPFAAGPAPVNWTRLLSNRPVLWGVITVMVIALGWGLYQAAQRTAKLPEN